MAAPPPSPPPDKPAWLDQPPTWLAPPAGAVPEPPPPPQTQQPDAPPAWATPAPRSSRLWIYLAGAMALVVLVGGGVFVRGQILAMQAANDAQIPQTTQAPLLSDYERANRFINVDLTPSLAGAIGPLQQVGNTCSTSTLVPACKDALIATSKAMIATDDVISKGDIPVCIAREVRQFKDDWEGMMQGVSLAISGFNANSKDLYIQGMVKFAEIAQYYKADSDRITAAENTCSKATRQA